MQFNDKHTSATRKVLGSENLEIEGIGFTKPHQLVVFGKMCAERGERPFTTGVGVVGLFTKLNPIANATVTVLVIGVGAELYARSQETNPENILLISE